MEEQLYRKFFEVETSHWWFVARQEIVHHIVRTQTSLTHGANVLDVGCGTGAVLASFSKDFNAFGTDTSPLAIEYCKQRRIEKAFVCSLDTFPFPNLRFDLILLLDVIEHIDDDQGIVNQAARLLKPGGYLLITVPAYEFLWSHHDEINLHKRRYVKKRLGNVVEQAGLSLSLLSYFNTFLFPLALLGRLSENLLGSTKDRTLDIPPSFVNSLLGYIFSMEKFLLGRVPLPFGLSIVALAKKAEA